jgi:hypothetical protein
MLQALFPTALIRLVLLSCQSVHQKAKYWCNDWAEKLGLVPGGAESDYEPSMRIKIDNERQNVRCNLEHPSE